MEFTEKTLEELEQRKLEIAEAVNADDADLDALESEVRAINEEIEKRRAEDAAKLAEEARKAEIRKAVANGAGQPVKEIKEENHNMTVNEVRASKEYIEAFARYIVSEDDKECRALLTVHATNEDAGISGTVPVPTYVEERVRTNWEKLGLLSLIRKTYVRGNMTTAFEAFASPAGIHAEGTEAPEEEELLLGVVTLIPQYIKKWVSVSDMTLEIGMGGAEAFLDYIYDELTYQIAKYAESMILGMIANAPTSADANAVSVSELSDDGTDIMGVVFDAIAHLSDEATNPVIVMNKLSYAAFKSAQVSANYAVDPFDGLPVYFNNALAALDSANDGDCWLIVGDFGRGVLGNFPAGTEIRVTRDDYTLAPQNLVRFIGKMLVALGLVADKCFTRVVFSLDDPRD